MLYWLSGLTCDDTNFIFKAGAFRYLAEHVTTLADHIYQPKPLSKSKSLKGLVIVCPDTSPRNLNIPGDADAWDFGVAAVLQPSLPQAYTSRPPKPALPHALTTRPLLCL